MIERTVSPGSESSVLIYGDESYKIVGACIEVHKTLGPGFLEPVYQEALEIELRYRSIPSATKQYLSIDYRGQQLESKFQPDLVCYEKIIVEIKALKQLGGPETAQTMNYLKIAVFKLGLLINFGSYGKLETKRLVF